MVNVIDDNDHEIFPRDDAFPSDENNTNELTDEATWVDIFLKKNRWGHVAPTCKYRDDITHYHAPCVPSSYHIPRHTDLF